MPAVRGPAAHDAALHASGAHEALPRLVPEVRVSQQLAVATKHEEAAEVVPPDVVAMAAAKIHPLGALLALVQSCRAGQGAMEQHEFILGGVPLDVVNRSAVRVCNDAGLRAVCPQEVEVAASIVALARVVHLHRGLHQEGAADVVPLHLHRLRLEEVLGRGLLAGVIQTEDLAPGGLALVLGDADGHVRRPRACAFGRHLEGHDARCVDPSNLGLISVAAAGHDLHAIRHHAAAVGFQGRPLQRGPRHVRQLLQREGEAQDACLGTPHAHVVAGILDVALVSDDVVG
mmetsp:Transcript_54353/g.97997  ORF Transcript_54353/g.97997 Transcript_54353/m.97997 type:complete len:288 (-) Transcript_54353:324-1187(-)